jgi:hypothetical protein
MIGRIGCEGVLRIFGDTNGDIGATHAHGASNHDRGGFAAVIAIRRQKIKASISLTPSAPPTPGANADGKRIT